MQVRLISVHLQDSSNDGLVTAVDSTDGRQFSAYVVQVKGGA